MSSNDTKAWGIIAAAVIAVVALTLGFGGASSGSNARESDAVAEIDIQGMNFVPNRVDIPAGENLVLKITNSDNQQHDLKIGAAKTPRIDPGTTIVYDFGEVAENTQGWCTIAGHKAMGMVFDVSVS